jgi:hypothetical protein
LGIFYMMINFIFIQWKSEKEYLYSDCLVNLLNVDDVTPSWAQRGKKGATRTVNSNSAGHPTIPEAGRQPRVRNFWKCQSDDTRRCKDSPNRAQIFTNLNSSVGTGLTSSGLPALALSTEASVVADWKCVVMEAGIAIWCNLIIIIIRKD